MTSKFLVPATYPGVDLECRGCVATVLLGGALYCKTLAQYQQGMITLLKAPHIGRLKDCPCLVRTEPPPHQHETPPPDASAEDGNELDQATTLPDQSDESEE